MCLYISKLIKRCFIAQGLICVYPRPICNTEMWILDERLHWWLPSRSSYKIKWEPLKYFTLFFFFFLQNADAKRKETDGNAVSIHGSV